MPGTTVGTTTGSQRVVLDVEEVGLTDRFVGFACDAVELEVDGGDTGIGELLRVSLPLSEIDAVRVDLDVFESHSAGALDEIRKIVMDGRFAAGELDGSRTALVTNRLEEVNDVFDRELFPSWSRTCEAVRTREVAVLRDFDDGETGVVAVDGEVIAGRRAGVRAELVGPLPVVERRPDLSARFAVLRALSSEVHGLIPCFVDARNTFETGQTEARRR